MEIGSLLAQGLAGGYSRNPKNKPGLAGLTSCQLSMFPSLKDSSNASQQPIAMSAYLKGTLASVPQHLQSLQSLQVGPYLRRVRLPQLQLPQTDFQSRATKLHSRNPKAVILFLLLVFLFFWKDIIYDVSTHVIGPRKAALAGDNSPIRNGTLGVSSISSVLPVPVINQFISSKISSCFRCPNEATGESPS